MKKKPTGRKNTWKTIQWGRLKKYIGRRIEYKQTTRIDEIQAETYTTRQT